MDTMTPVYGSGTLLLIAAVAVAVLLVLIMCVLVYLQSTSLLSWMVV